MTQLERNIIYYQIGMRLKTIAKYISNRSNYFTIDQYTRKILADLEQAFNIKKNECWITGQTLYERMLKGRPF